jgi:hypothetical protein
MWAKGQRVGEVSTSCHDLKGLLKNHIVHAGIGIFHPWQNPGDPHEEWFGKSPAKRDLGDNSRTNFK